MKEFTLPLDKQLAAGLAPERTLKFGPHLDECENMIVRAGRLISPDRFTQPTVDSATWPLPQLFEHRGQVLVAGDDSLHILNESTNTAGSALSLVEGREDYTPTTTKALSAGGGWTLVSLGPSFILFNKEAIIFKLPAFGDVYCATDHINLYAGARHHNRLWLGGFSDRSGKTAFFTASRWTNAFAEWLNWAPSAVETGEAVDAGYVFYGMPHGGDVDRPYTAEFALFGCPNNAAFDALKTHIYGALREGMMGFVRLVRGGTIYKLLPLGSALVAYSSRAVEVINQREDGRYEAQVLLDAGVIGPGAVAGDSLGHVFVSKQGALYRLGSDLALKRLGFEEHLEPLMTATDAETKFVMSIEPRFGDVYLCNDTTGYVLGEDRLTKVHDPPTSIVSVGTSVLATNTEDQELVTNGSFSSDTGWTKGNGWSINGGKAHWTKKAGTLSQSPSTAVDTPYRINYTISNWAGANTDAAIYLSLGDQNGQVVEDDGTYEDILTPKDVTNGLIFHPTVTSRGSLDSVSINSLRRFKLTSGVLQFNTTGRKTIKVIELRGENLRGLLASVYWRNGQGDAWRQSEWRSMGNGAALITAVTGVELKISVQGYFYDNDPDGTERSIMDGFSVRYQLPDRRFIRGTYQGQET